MKWAGSVLTIAVCTFVVMVPFATADVPDEPYLFPAQLAEFSWTGSGDGTSWQTAGNWTAPTFPAMYPYTIPTFPNDPGRVDGNVNELWPIVGANLSGPLGAI